jgi:prepilin-type N-terminal cleavage/methylation domain-containing protein
MRVSRFRSRNKKGFTLVEILVVVTITALLSAYVVSYTRTGQRQITLYIEKQKIAGLILKAKSLAIESFTQVSQGNCGYGLAVNYGQRSYSIFYYATSTASSQPKYVQCPQLKISGSLVLQQVVTSSDVMQLNTDLAFPSSIDSFPDALYYVLFVPPAPQTLIAGKNGNILPDSGTIYFNTSDGSASTTVTVNPAGQVNF